MDQKYSKRNVKEFARKNEKVLKWEKPPAMKRQRHYVGPQIKDWTSGERFQGKKTIKNII